MRAHTERRYAVIRPYVSGQGHYRATSTYRNRSDAITEFCWNFQGFYSEAGKAYDHISKSDMHKSENKELRAEIWANAKKQDGVYTNPIELTWTEKA